MRALLSVTTLLLVVLLVMKLAATPLRALAPAGPVASAAATRGNTGPHAAQQAAERVQRAIEQGAAQRAEDAASR